MNDQLVVPPPTRQLSVADLAGEWKHEDGIVTSYVDASSGAYAGYDSVAYRETWTIGPDGAIASDFFAIRGSQTVTERTTGTVEIAGAVLDVRLGSRPRFAIRGWLEGPAMTVLKICGPFYDEVPADILGDPNQGWNLNQFWVRRAPGAA